MKLKLRLNKTFESPEEKGEVELPEKYIYKKVKEITVGSFRETIGEGVMDFEPFEAGMVFATMLADSNMRGRLATYNFLPGVAFEVPNVPNKTLTAGEESSIDKVRDKFPVVPEPQSGWQVWKQAVIEKGSQLMTNTVKFIRGIVTSETNKGLQEGLAPNQIYKEITKLNIPGVYIDQVLNYNIIKSFNQGRVELSDLYEYVGGWRVVTMSDSRTRPSHRKLHGMEAPKDHLIWTYYFPPYGYNCRCVVQAVVADKIKEVKTDVPIPPAYTRDGLGPDYEWFGHHPGEFYGIQ